MSDLRLVVLAGCPYCGRVESFINENRLNDDVKVLNVTEDQSLREELIAKGGKAQYPALLQGQDIMYESLDIIDYLKEKFL